MSVHVCLSIRHTPIPVLYMYTVSIVAGVILDSLDVLDQESYSVVKQEEMSLRDV